ANWRDARATHGRAAPDDGFVSALPPGRGEAAAVARLGEQASRRRRGFRRDRGFRGRVVYISGYRCMWVVTMFDLPVDTKAARRAYAQFRKKLLRDGFTQMQFSVYIRHCASEENAAV